MIDIYLNLKIYVFLIKNCDIKIFLLFIFINAIILYLLFNMIISSFNMRD